MFFCQKKIRTAHGNFKFDKYCSHKFLKVFLHESYSSYESYSDLSATCGAGLWGICKKVCRKLRKCWSRQSSILVPFIILDNFDRVAQSLVLEKQFRGQWGSGNFLNVTVNQTKPLFRLQPPADGRPFYLVKNSLSSLIKEVEGSRTVLKVISFQSGQIQLFSNQGVFGSIWWHWFAHCQHDCLEALQEEVRTLKLSSVLCDGFRLI